LNLASSLPINTGLYNFKTKLRVTSLPQVSMTTLQLQRSRPN